MTDEELHISFEDYSAIVAAVTRPPKHLRAGQAGMNELYMRNKPLYCAVVEKGLDPFYQDDKVCAFLEFLAERLE